MMNRRNFLKTGLACWAYLTGLIPGKVANALSWPAQKFGQTNVNQLMALYFNHKKIVDSNAIDVKIPAIAENGAVVPIAVTPHIDNASRINILVEKNPVPLVAQFELSPDMEAYVSTRIKMAASSEVIVLVETPDTLYRTRQRVAVTIGGCGD